MFAYGPVRRAVPMRGARVADTRHGRDFLRAVLTGPVAFTPLMGAWISTRSSLGINSGASSRTNQSLTVGAASLAVHYCYPTNLKKVTKSANGMFVFGQAQAVNKRNILGQAWSGTAGEESISLAQA